MGLQSWFLQTQSGRTRVMAAAGVGVVAAFVVGMTFQVSDTDITQRSMRHEVLSPRVVSFLFGAVILASLRERARQPAEPVARQAGVTSRPRVDQSRPFFFRKAAATSAGSSFCSLMSSDIVLYAAVGELRRHRVERLHGRRGGLVRG